MIKKLSIAFLFFIISGFSILAMRGRLLYLDASYVASETNMEAKIFHFLYLSVLVAYIFFTYLFFKTDSEEDHYKKIMMGMAFPAYILGLFGIVAGVGCAVLGCTYGAVYDEYYGTLLNLEFLDRFFGDKAETLYKFTVKMPF